jgi:selenocysteine-specific elongation factor
MHLVVGTAGHIDHGKTALVKALTGVNADRLPEEKQRGITIDLGFAEMTEGDVQIGFVDVPGHERFVKNMLAGASGIDVALLVIAADEGVMPQTREHFEICRLLRIKNGIVALTKTDLVDAELLDLVKDEVAELTDGSFLESSTIVPVSSKTGEGVQELRSALVDIAESLPSRQDDFVARLPIDRSFTVKGFGSVVTGTLASGTISEGAELELLPTERNVRVRGIQSHGRSVGEAVAGRRTAVNLGGIDHGEIERGMLLAEPGVLRPAQMFDAEVEVLKGATKSLRSRQRVRLHIGTAEILARVVVLNEAKEIVPGEAGLVQLRLESPAAAIAGERFIIRSYSPQVTIAGGSTLRPTAEKPRKKTLAAYVEILQSLVSSVGDKPKFLIALVEAAGENCIDRGEIRSITGWRADVFERTVTTLVSNSSVVDAGGMYLSTSVFKTIKSAAVAEVERHHKADPLSKGLSLDALREKVFKFTRPEIQKATIADLISAGTLVAEKEVVRLASHSAELSPSEQKAFDSIKSAYTKAGLEAPKTDEVLAEVSRATSVDPQTARKVFQMLRDSGEITQISNEFYFSKLVIDGLISKLRTFASATPDRIIDVAKFKELAGISRKYAIPLLEYFDREKVTARRGDKRYIL